MISKFVRFEGLGVKIDTEMLFKALRRDCAFCVQKIAPNMKFHFYTAFVFNITRKKLQII